MITGSLRSGLDVHGDTGAVDWHVAGEQGLRSSGLGWTVLSPSSFAANALSWAGPVRAGEPIANVTGAGGAGRDRPEGAWRKLAFGR
ncbi:hypothetical protein [Nonomuraea aridisoli]|uniref:Uncharacterized protein n=1 Tax=Nonomuraea aridisoli TaxID=2070368 RepID=A0A2W2EBN0_9ACTN|nr:hypothetical protein [Nonomuraea aridisoli]PZG10960.1 hypothetical protein C1J01_35415 [Nonomuraea aridisoli]